MNLSKTGASCFATKRRFTRRSERKIVVKNSLAVRQGRISATATLPT